MLRVRNLFAAYDSLAVLQNVSIHVREGEIVTIIGGNGAGKTTLLSTIAGLHKSSYGKIEFRGEDIRETGAEETARRGCVLVPEGRELFASMSVYENLLLGGYKVIKKKGQQSFREELERIYEIFPILAERAGQFAGTLSGGEQQMLAIGRGLMSKPSLLMLDEPSMGLAPQITKRIFSVLSKLREAGTTILLVEQNAHAALRLADRAYVLATGQILLEGSAEEILSNPDVRRAYLGKDYRSIDETGPR